MARRSSTSAPLIHASAGAAAPLIHASVGPSAPLTQAHIANAHAPIPSLGGVGRVSAAGAKKAAGGAGAGGGNFRIFRNDKGDFEFRDATGKVVKKGSGREFDSILQRGHAGASMNAHDTAIFQEATVNQPARAEEEAAAKAKKQAELDAEQRRKDEWDRQHGIIRQEQLADAQRKADADAKAKADAQAQADAQEDAFNERYGVDKGVRLSNAEKKNLVDGTHTWGYDPKKEDEIKQMEKDAEDGRINGTLSDADFAMAMDQIDKRRQMLRKGLQQKPVDPNRPNVQEIDGKRYVQNGTKWELLDQEPAKSPQEIVEGAFTASDGSRYISDGKGGVTLLPSAKPDDTAAKAEDSRRKYILGRLEAARKDFNGRDPDAEGYDPDATFDSEAAIKSAGADWDAVYGKSDAGGGDAEPSIGRADDAQEEDKQKAGVYSKTGKRYDI